MTATTFTTTKTVTREQETLIRDNMALVGHMVREMLFKVPAHVHRDDLASAGYAALVTATPPGASRSAGSPHSGYAAPCSTNYAAWTGRAAPYGPAPAAPTSPARN
jgi:RNA polymerase sigma factor FliA